MLRADRSQALQDAVGSAHIFASAVDERMEERLRAVTEEQLTFSQLKLLKLIARTDANSVGRVAAFLRVSCAAASKAVDRLVRRGLLRRGEAEGDRRTVELGLTEEGVKLLAQYEMLAKEVLEEILGDVPTDGLRQAAELLDRFSVSVLTRDATAAEACYRCSSYFREKCVLWGSGRVCHLYSHMVGNNEANIKPTAPVRGRHEKVPTLCTRYRRSQREVAPGHARAAGRAPVACGERRGLPGDDD